MGRFTRVDQVADSGLCLGCGACQPICPTASISIVDDRRRQAGLRPRVNDVSCEGCGHCVQVCPAIYIRREKAVGPVIPSLKRAWGSVREVWEGYASDPEIRFKGSSGGAATALSALALDVLDAKAVFHVRGDEKQPVRNRVTMSTTRSDLLDAMGSRYAPAALWTHIEQLLESPGPVVVVGKPCDIVALHKLKRHWSKLEESVMFTIAIFCAGTPSTSGTLEILDELDCDERSLQGIRYRGYGWPGETKVGRRNEEGGVETRSMTYQESWSGILTNHVQPRCRLCPDATGEFADISVGDPWYRAAKSDQYGFSMVLTRSAVGKRVVEAAMEHNYLHLWSVSPSTLPASQLSLHRRRQELFGRLLARRLMGMAVPKFRGFSLVANWNELPFRVRFRVLVGQLRRLSSRRLHRLWRLQTQVASLISSMLER